MHAHNVEAGLGAQLSCVAYGLGRVETRRGWFLSDLRLAAKGMPRASGLDGGNQRFDANDVHDPGEIVGKH